MGSFEFYFFLGDGVEFTLISKSRDTVSKTPLVLAEGRTFIYTHVWKPLFTGRIIELKEKESERVKERRKKEK